MKSELENILLEPGYFYKVYRKSSPNKAVIIKPCEGITGVRRMSPGVDILNVRPFSCLLKCHVLAKDYSKFDEDRHTLIFIYHDTVLEKIDANLLDLLYFKK